MNLFPLWADSWSSLLAIAGGHNPYDGPDFLLVTMTRGRRVISERNTLASLMTVFMRVSRG
jgi:hypothetical protein